jgi:hypothetical protein
MILNLLVQGRGLGLSQRELCFGLIMLYVHHEFAWQRRMCRVVPKGVVRGAVDDVVVLCICSPQ